MASRQRKTGRIKILNEIKSQLVLQAERWGRKEYYTPIKLCEMELDQADGIRSDLLSERSNLEYELHTLDSNKKDLLIKLERLAGYLKKARRVIEKHKKTIGKELGKIVKEKNKLKLILKKLKPENTFSVLLSNN